MAQFKRAVPFAAAAILFANSGLTAQISSSKPVSVANSDKTETANFPLTAASFAKYTAAVRAYDKLMMANPELRKQIDTESTSKTIADSVSARAALLDKHPPVVTAIKSAGLSSRDYVLLTYTLIHTDMAVAMKKNGTIKQYPSSLSPANVAFVEENFSKVESLLMQGPDQSH